MKKHSLLLAICAMLLVFGACGNGQNKNEKEDKAQLVEQPAVTTTPDLVFCDLQGPVKRCDSYEFDRSGRLVALEGVDPFALDEPYRDFDTVTFDYTDFCKWIRDGQGQIASIECYESFQQFTWSDGLVIESIDFYEAQKTVTVNEYDADGRLVKKTLYNGMEDEDVESKDASMLFATIEYTYVDFDDHGNWTRRKAKWSDASADYVNEEEETRTIEYYQ